MAALLDYIVHFDGYPLQAYLLENIDVIGYIASCYLVMVGKGDRILRWWNKNSSKKAGEAAQNGTSKSDAAALQSCFKAAAAYHTVMAVACAVLSCALVPTFLHSILSNSFFDTMCIWDDARTYKGYVGFALGAAVLVKVTEQLDTFFLVVRDYIVSSPEQEKQQPRRLTPSHWWFQVLIALYFWHTFSVGTSCFGMIATFSLALSTARNVLYIQQDKAQAAGNAKKAAQLGEILANVDIAECVGSSLLSIYASYQNYTNARGCMTIQANVRMALVMYVVEVILIVRQRAARVTAKSAVGEKKKKQ